jgi:exodeoxyribonuclease III
MLHRAGERSRRRRLYDIVVAGDFNNNVLWDRPRKRNNHAMTVEELGALDLKSAYHETRGIAQGNEPDPTIYWRDRRLNGPRYHIDYCFVPKRWINATSVVLGRFDAWIANRLSDHVPLIVDVNEVLAGRSSTHPEDEAKPTRPDA